MKCVVDSNYLQADELRAYLHRSRGNAVVFTDYAFLEAIKGDTLASIHKSLAILAEYPEQVLVLKTTYAVCGLHGGSRGLQRRLVDVPRTREFAIFCQALRNAQRGEPSMTQELLRLGREASAHMQAVRDDAPKFAATGLDAATMFSREEQRAILNAESLPPALLRTFAQATIWQAEILFANHPAVHRLPTRSELANTYLYRSSLCHLILIVKWSYDGGTSSNPDRIRNSMVDTHFAAYSTYYDDLLSRDRTATLIARQARRFIPSIPSLLQLSA